MIKSAGRGLGGSQKRRACVSFHLTKTLPALFTYARNDTAATHRDNAGKLCKATAANTPRFDHDETGFPFGLLMEGTIQNKLTLYNAVPTATTGITTSGTATISLVTDATALAAAGLDQIITGNVFQAVGGASGGNITLPGTTGSTSNHSFSAYIRITAGTAATLTHTGTSAGTQTLNGATWKRFKLEDQTISGPSVQMRIAVPASTTILFILPQMEQNKFCTSVIVTAGAAATRQRDDLTLTSLNTRPFWNIAAGWLLARYRVMGNMAADQYPLMAHSGNTNNCIGLRISAAGFSLQANVRASSASKMSLAGTLEHSAGVATAGLITWKSGYSCICGQASSTSTTYSGDPTGITTLQIGARNGGSDPFFGHISMIEIGRQPMTAAQISRRLKRSTDLTIIGAGQSLMGGHFSSSDGGSQGGHKKTIESIQSIRKDDHAIFINGATSSSAACKTSNDTNYWWDKATGTAGPALTTFHTLVTDAAMGINAIIWSQGEQDSFYILDETSAVDYKAALLAIFNNMRSRIGNVPVFIQRIGRRTGAFNNAGGIQAIRDIQKELIDTYDWIHEASEVYDQTLYDDIHPSNAGYLSIAARNGVTIAKIMNNQTIGYGPSMTSVSRSGTNVTVTLTHNGGDDFSPASGISGFTFMDGGSPITISSAVRTNATTITLTLATTPVSPDKKLYYIYDTASSITLGNVVYDNAGMPLRTGFVSVI